MALISRKLMSFAPDLDPLSDGVIVDGNDFVPTMKGMRTLPDLLPFRSVPPLTNVCTGCAAFQLPELNEFGIVVAGTAGPLPTLNLNAGLPGWITQLQPDPLPLDARWRFAPVTSGEALTTSIIIAVNGVEPPWVTRVPSLGVWTPLEGNPPIASIVATSDFSVFLIEPDSAKWHSTFNPTIWTDAIETQTVSDTLGQTAGPITAAKALRSNMVLYKADGIWLGTFGAPPAFWTFTEISRQVGAPSQDSVVNADDVHYFVGPDDFWRFDGFSVNRIPNPVREWFFDRVNTGGLRFIQGRFDPLRSLIFWHYPTKFGTLEWVCLNIRTNPMTWGVGQLEFETVIDGARALQDVLAPTRASGLVLTDHLPYTYDTNGTRTTNGAFLVTGDLGDRSQMFQLSRVRPGFTIQAGVPAADPVPATTPTLNVLGTYTPGGAYATGPTLPLSPDGWFNFVTVNRLQRLRLNASADCELTQLGVDIQPAGDV